MLGRPLLDETRSAHPTAFERINEYKGSVLELWQVSGSDLPGLDVLVVASFFSLPCLAA